MDNFTMPPLFPMEEYRAFGLATIPFFPAILSDENMNDPLHRRTHFDWAWQAVRYRYRSASECNDEFQALLANPSERWLNGWDEEFTYKLEQCIYAFFMNGLSVFDSFAYALYFLGHAVEPGKFPHAKKLRSITRNTTADGFHAAFAHATITKALVGLSVDASFRVIDELRNILGHRLSGRRGVRSSSTLHGDGTFTTNLHEETCDVPGASASLTFEPKMLQLLLEDIAALVKKLTVASREFAENHAPATVIP